MTFHATYLQFQLVNSVGGLDISAGIPLLHRVGVTSKGEYWSTMIRRDEKHEAKRAQALEMVKNRRGEGEV